MAQHLLQTIHHFKIKTMKKLSFGILILSVFMVSCNSNDTSKTNTSSDSTTTSSSSLGISKDSLKSDTGSVRSNSSMNNGSGATTNTSSTSSATPVDAKTIEFVNKAASGGMMEVQLGQLAKQKAVSPRVKDFGSMMNTDHTNAINELKNLASAKNLPLPASLSAADQKHVDAMGKMTGKSFDKMYMDMMVNDHKKDIAEFKKASNDLKDADIKSFAGKTLPVLEKHMDSATAIHRKM